MSGLSTDNQQYDLFISYAHSDNRGAHDGWVEALVEAIQEEHRKFTPRPLSIFLDLHEIRTMQDWEHRILASLRGSRLMLAVLSPAYFNSQYCRLEWQRYRDHELERALVGEGIAPIYVVAAPAFDDEAQAALDDWRKDLRRRQYLDVRDLWSSGIEALRSEDVRRRIEQLNQSLSTQLERAERVLKSPNNVPLHNSHFVGRIDELRRLRESLAHGKVGAVSAVHGLGGVGKSALAFEYAHAFGAEYPGGRFLLNAAGFSDLRLLLATLAPHLGLALADAERADPDAALAQVRAALLRRGTTLLVLDNVDQPALLTPERLAHYLPQREQIHVLATTRLSPDRLTGLDCLTLDVLPVSDGVRLLERYRKMESPAERDAAEQIVRRLGGHTLALEVVGVYLWKMEVSYGDYLARLQREGLTAVDDAAREDAVQLSRHPEKLLGSLLESTLVGLAPSERLAVEYAALLPPDQVALPWLRGLVGAKFPELARPAAPGHPDAWRRLEMRLSGLRLLTPADEPQLARMHRLVQDVVRARLSAADRAERSRELLLAIEARGRLLRHGEAAQRWEVEALRSFVLQLADRPDGAWDELTRAATAYCGAAERMRSAGAVMEEWAANGEITRLQTALAEERDVTRRGLESLCAAVVLAQDDRYEELAEALWTDALQLLIEPLSNLDKGLPGHRPATGIIARVLLEKGSPRGGAAALPVERPAAREAAQGERLSLPWWLRCAGRMQQASAILMSFGIASVMLMMALGLLFWPLGWLLGSETMSDAWTWIAAPATVVFLLGFFGGLLLNMPVEFVIGWLRRRIARNFAELARGSERSPTDADRRQALRQALDFRAQLNPGSNDKIAELCRAIAPDLAYIVRHGVPAIAHDRAELTKAIERIVPLEAEVVDALAETLHGVPADVLREALRASAVQPLTLAALRLHVGLWDHLQDAGLLVELFPRAPSTSLNVPACAEILHALPAPVLARALRTSMRLEGNAEPATWPVPWTRPGRRALADRLEALELSPRSFSNRRLPGLLMLPAWGFIIAVLGVSTLVVTSIFQGLWQLVLIAGRYHDPTGAASPPWEQRRMAQAEFATSLRRGAGLPYRPGVTQRWLENVLRRLLRRGPLQSRLPLLLYYMGQGTMLRLITRWPPPPGEELRAAPRAPTKEEAAEDAAQLASAWPIASVWRSYLLVTVLALAASAAWLALLMALAPAAAPWWRGYGMGSTLAIAALGALAQHYPRYAKRRGLIGVMILAAALAMHHFAMRRAEAQGINVPGLDYGWTLLYVLLPLAPLLFANLLVPEAIAWWRGGPLLYPRPWQRAASRLAAVLGSAASCMVAAALTAYMVLDYSPPELAPAPWPAGSDREATRIVSGTLEKVETERQAILAPPGGRRGEELRIHFTLKDTIVERGDSDQPSGHARATRLIIPPTDRDGKPVFANSGQWFVPPAGAQVRLYLDGNRVIDPNGLDVMIEERWIHVDEVVPLQEYQLGDSPISTWELLKILLVLGMFLVGFLAVVWLLGTGWERGKRWISRLFSRDKPLP